MAGRRIFSPSRPRNTGTQVITTERLSVRRDRQTGRWALRRGDKLVRTFTTWRQALLRACAIADSDRRAARGRR